MVVPQFAQPHSSRAIRAFVVERCCMGVLDFPGPSLPAPWLDLPPHLTGSWVGLRKKRSASPCSGRRNLSTSVLDSGHFAVVLGRHLESIDRGMAQPDPSCSG